MTVEQIKSVEPIQVKGEMAFNQIIRTAEKIENITRELKKAFGV